MDNEIPDDFLNSLVEPQRSLIKEQLELAYAYCVKDEIESAIDVLNSTVTLVRNNSGLPNNVLLFVQTRLAIAYYKQENYKTSLNIMSEVYEKQSKTFGPNSEQTLRSQSIIGLILMGLKEYNKALQIFRDILPKQREIIGLKHKDAMFTHSSLATCLINLNMNEEAVRLNKELSDLKKDGLGDKNLETIASQYNLALTYGNLKNYDKAIDLLSQVFNKRKKILGMKHSDTLRPMYNIATMYHSQNKFEEAENYYLEAMKKQKRNLGTAHVETLKTQFDYGYMLFQVGRYEEQIKIHRDTSEKMKLMEDANHPDVVMMEKMIANSEIFLAAGEENSESGSLLKYLLGTKLSSIVEKSNDVSIYSYVISNDAAGLKKYLLKKTNVNVRDGYERTPLHYAVNNGNSEIISILLENGADIAAVTQKGNTVIHTAVVQEKIETLNQLLKVMQSQNLEDILNARTVLKGQTALHQASKKCNILIIRLLLEYGAIFEIKDNDEKTPKMNAGNKVISDFFTLLESLFEAAECGNIELPLKLKSLMEYQPLDMRAIFKAKNINQQTLIQVVLFNKHKDIASDLQLLMKEIKLILY